MQFRISDCIKPQIQQLMKRLQLFVLAALLMLGGCQPRTTKSSAGTAVNPIVGDAGYIQRYGHAPSADATEEERVGSHLEYAEALLRQKDVSGMDAALRQRRSRLLDLLHEYRLAGLFPRNYDHPKTRRPCFIDREGRICAVGYLVEQTAGRAAAESINSRHQYDDLLAMKDPEVNRWLAANGLNEEEAAIIQPNYAPSYSSTNYISKADAVASGLLIGTNTALSAVNLATAAQRRPHTALPVAGVFTGIGQIVYGAILIGNDQVANGKWSAYNEGQKVLSLVNISVGAATVVTSFCNMAARPARDRRNSYGLFSAPLPGGQAAVGLSFVRRL